MAGKPPKRIIAPPPGDPPAGAAPSDMSVVQGEVRQGDGSAMAGLVVKLFDKRVRDDRLLGDARTGEGGAYRVHYPRNGRPVNLLVKAFDGAGKIVAVSAVVFGAKEKEVVNLSAGGAAFRSAPAYEITQEEISRALDIVSLADATNEQRAIVEKTTGLDRGEIELQACAARVARATGLDAEALFGMFKMGLPTETSALLAQPRALQKEALEKALARNAVSARLKDRIEPTLKRLRELAVENALAPDPAGRPSTLQALLATVLPDGEQKVFVAKYIGHTGTPREFWDALVRHRDFTAKAQGIKEVLQLSVLTRNHAPLMKELQKRRKSGKLTAVRDLAAWTENDWLAVLTPRNGPKPIGAPEGTPGKDAAERSRRYARSLARVFERAYPSTAALGRLAKGKLKIKRDLALFIRNNPTFDLAGPPVDKFLDENPHALDGLADQAGFTRSLETMYRLFKIAPPAAHMEALMADGIASSREVTAMGRDKFAYTYGPGMGEGVARKIWDRASLIHGAAMNIMLDYAPVLDVPVAGIHGRRKGNKIKRPPGVPDWETLFGSMELCECEHCRSVLSPAAYFTDALHFLSKRAAKNPARSAKQVLFDRRPDLGHIELTCKNTNTVLPYVDLANEILEEAVSPGTGTPLRQRQTTGTAEELAANPEHVNGGAYTKLRQTYFPGRLPFDLWTEEARIYLEHLGVARADLMKALQKPGPAPTEAAVAAERLGLTRAERLIVTGQYAALDPAAPPQRWTFWGFAAAGTWVADTAKLRPFMKKAGLTYDETEELLKCRFINAAGNLRIAPEPGAPVHTGDTSLLMIQNLSDEVLDRVQRFLRLWRRLGWTMHETDAAITLLSAAEPDVNRRISDALLIKLGQLRLLEGSWKLPVESLLTFWALIDIAGEDSQYRRLFQNKAVTQPVDPDFALGAGGELAVVAAAPANARISTHTATVLAGLAMTAHELAILTPGVVSESLTRANLSALHRHVLLARALKMSVADVVALKNLSGVDPFDPADATAASRFREIAAKIQAANQTVSGLDYLLRHRIAPASGLGPVGETQALVLGPLRAGLASISRSNALPQDPAGVNEAFLKDRLSIILDETAVEKVLTLVTDIRWTDATAKNAVVDSSLATFLDATQAKTRLVGPPPTLPYTDLKARIRYVLTPLLAYLARTQSEALVKQTFADALGLEAETAAALLERWVPAVSDVTRKAMAEYLAPTFAASNPAQPVTAANFPAAFKLFTRLEKIASVFSAFKATAAEAAHVLASPAGAGWLNPAALPAAAGDPAAAFSGWERLSDLFTLRNEIPGGWETLGGLFILASAAAVSEASFLDALSQATGWNRKDVDDLTGPAGFNMAYPAAYRDERALARLKDAFALLRRLGVSAVQAGEWTDEAVTESPARAAKQAAAAKYDADEWLKRAKPLRDVLRQKQRLALVDYMVNRPPASLDWQDTNDLYAHFLIDVEMCPCMMTSRIKQAILSTQLFVQRSFLNVEPGVAVDAAADASWLQWNDWMKNYRVWEANRKIFLWPENWIMPAFMDDKTPFFEEFQNDLLQGDVTTATAETAFMNYLEKVDEASRLEVVGMYHQEEKDAGGQIVLDRLHVVGRTANSPRRYFYRCRERGEVWTAWRKIDLDIQSDQVIPIVWERRLHIIWPVFSDLLKDTSVTMPKTGENIPSHPPSYKIQLFWSELKHGAWGQPKLSEEFAESYKPSVQDWMTREESFFVRAFIDGEDMVARLYRAAFSTSTGSAGGKPFLVDIRQVCLAFADFRFAASDGRPRVEAPPDSTPPLALPKETFQQDGVFTERIRKELLPVDAGERLFITAGDLVFQPPTGFGSFGSFTNRDDVLTLNRTPGYFHLTPPHQEPLFTSNRSFFYKDFERTYHVVPGEAQVIVGYLLNDPPLELVPHAWDDVAWVEEVPVPNPAGPVVDNLRPVEGWRATPSYPVESSALRVADRAAPRLDRSPASASFQPEPIVFRSETAGTVWETRSDAGYIWTQFHPSVKPVPIYSTEKYYDFRTFYHPFVTLFKKELRRDGIDGLLQRKLQLTPHLFIPKTAPFSFQAVYQPEKVVKKPYPLEEVDFSACGTYAQYNWELFFHAPLMIAEKLSQNLRFAEAQKWFHYIFNPTDASPHVTPQRYWQVAPFFNTTSQDYQDQKIENMMNNLATGTADEELTAQVRAWREKPFNPYLVARLRTVAFQKAVVMKYLDNIIAWADFNFRTARDLEQLNEATALYILAAEILGRRPDITRPRALPGVKTYNEIEPDLDDFSNALVEAEALVPPSPDGISPPVAPPPVTLPDLLYFCIPRNDKLLGYWDTVSDRLFKLRNCQNIEGQELKLPLFEPPIDPALLIQARTAGLDLSSVLSDLNAPPPHYRFHLLVQKAAELIHEVKSLGAALVHALEQRDAESLALLRAGQEISVLEAVEKVRKDQILEAEENIKQLKAYETLVTFKQTHFQSLLDGGLIDHESTQKITQYVMLGAHVAQGALEGVAGILHLIPNGKVGAPTTMGVTYGGANVASGLQAFGAAIGAGAQAVGAGSALAGLSANWARRGQDWKHQIDLANKELTQIGRQLAAAGIRKAIAEKELANHKKQMSNAKDSDTFLRDKFTSKQLYDWMVTQLSAVYFQAYKLAFDAAKRAERAYQNELGLADSDFIQFGYWDGLKKGLLAGEKLLQDVQRLESSYLDTNRREYELVKHVSVALTDPAALVRLKETGECFLSLPETLFDMDHPGQYFRRLRSVSVTIPAVAGPYQGVHATLTLIKSSLRHDATTPAGGYARTGPDDARFRDTVGTQQSVATSHGANDAGLHELVFRDDRLLPFEGRGAVSDWKLTLDPEANRWDFGTLSDVILHVNYTAREGGEEMRREAKAGLPAGGVRLFSMRQEFSTEWHRFMHPADDAPRQELVFDLRGRFPYHRSGRDPRITRVDVYLKMKEPPNPAADIPVALFDDKNGTGINLLATPAPPPPPAPQDTPSPLVADPALARLHTAGKAFAAPKATGQWMLRVPGSQLPAFIAETATVGGATFKHLDRQKVEDVFVAATFTRP